MDIEEESINTLLSMGFANVKEIKRALRFSKNDINEAVAILTNEHPNVDYSLGGDQDVEMTETKPSRDLVPVLTAPPPYEAVVESQDNKSPNALNIQSGSRVMTNSEVKLFLDQKETGKECEKQDEVDQKTFLGFQQEFPNTNVYPESRSLEFPTTNLYELETRVFTDQWSIPYKKEESLGKCLISATQLANEGLCEAVEPCRRFIDYCMPEAFKKLLTSVAVRSWGLEVQEGIRNMLQLLVDFIAIRLKYEPVPERLLSHVLVMVLDDESEFNSKNKYRSSMSLHLMDVFGSEQPFAKLKNSGEPYGWLADLINRFGEQGGFTEIQRRFENEHLSGSAMAALLMPLAKCVEHLNPTRVCSFLLPCMDKAVEYINSLTDNDLKSKNIGSVTELLKAVKLLCLQLWPSQVTLTNNLCLDVILRMLKCQHFNARMNGLKEVTKLIDDSTGLRSSKIAIDADNLLEWLAENKVLSIALEGNIDQVQYSDKIKCVIEFLGPKLSLEELMKIWKMQEGQNAQIVDNIHNIMAAASAKFNTEQFDHLLSLTQATWEAGNDQIRKRLVAFIGRIGKETNQGKASTKVLDLLWDLAHSPALPTHLVEQVLEEHFNILSEVSHKDQTKKNYILRCVEDIKKEICVLPSLKLLHNICRNILKSGYYKQDKALHDLNKTHDIMKLVTTSLARCHKQAANSVGEGQVCPETLVDGRYSLEECLVEHLNFLQFLLQVGVQYLPWSRAKEIWDVLVTNPDACENDREMCFDWFNKYLLDLEIDTQSQLFQLKLLKLDPAQVTCKGFTCFKTYFDAVNTSENKFRRSGINLVVEKLDLTGLDFLWQVALSSPHEQIAEMAIENLLEVSYHALSSKLKKDLLSLHKRFISECYKRLEAVAGTVGGTAMFTAVSNATKTLTAMSVSEVASYPAPARTTRLQNICRLLQIAEQYVSSIEEMHMFPRTILPHGASFLGCPMSLKIVRDSTKEEFFLMSHSNETLGSLREKIAHHLHLSSHNIQLFCGDSTLTSYKDQKLLGLLGFQNKQVITVKSVGGLSAATILTSQAEVSTINDEPSGASYSSSAASAASSTSSHHTFLLEQEKMLPGVVMAAGGQVFEMLYQLATLEDPKITAQVRSILQLMPTDPAILDALDSISARKVVEIPSPGESGRNSPRTSPKKLTITSPSRERIDSPKDVLKSLFDITTQISPFRLLYNLEVLSGKLMPIMQDDSTLQSAQIFCEDFLSAAGLKLVLGVLQKDSMPSEVDYDIRQGCYLTALGISKYLLCGQTGLEENNHSSASSPRSSPRKSIEEFAIPASLVASAAALGAKHKYEIKTIQTVNFVDLMDTLSCIMRVAWAAAAGQLHLANCPLPAKNGSSYSSSGRRSRQSSTGSNASSGSEGENQGLHGGVCVQQEHVNNKDSLLAREALEFLVTCLQLRSDAFSSFSSLPCISDFIIDMLLGSASSEVRIAALEQFYKLSCTQVTSSPDPRHFLLQLLLKAHLPFWIPSSSTRGANQRLLSQCKEYFDLGCKLLNGLTGGEQQSLHIDTRQMIEDEISWLQGFSPSSSSDLQTADSALLAGHFNFIKALLTCDPVQKEEAGKILVPDLLNHFLFPASHLISSGTASSASLSFNFTPKCCTHESRVAAYDVLVELATGCVANMEQIVHHLIKMHHYVNLELAKEYEYEPLVAGRSPCGYVGLKNAGATCYMNSVIQQLYMQPGVRESILSVDEGDPDEDSFFYQFQMVFGHLLESQLQYHIPEKFWKCFLLWGQPINVREQQDAFEFFTHLIDQVDEYLKKNGWEPVFTVKYEGIFTDQKICQGCPHRYEREESFMALNLPIKTHNLLDSLDHFVKGELLEGYNAYFCEKCGEKRNTIKRTCIKTLPPVLVIQLKRFDYDWEANRALKFDDYFKFPWLLDMAPYTADGIQTKESLRSQGNEIPETCSASATSKLGSVLYELVGVVVHTGQANAGHYYSFIKERRPDSGINTSKWFKFNDTAVEEFDMTDSTLESECFGGTYKAKVRDLGNSYPETRQRYWNAYMLFYERMEEVIRTPRTPRKTPTKYSFRKTERDSLGTPVRTVRKSSPVQQEGIHRHGDSLSQLTRLVDRGEKQGLFLEKMPARIQQVVREENLCFMHNYDIYNESYFALVQRLAVTNIDNTALSVYSKLMIHSLQLGINFLFNTYLRYKKKTSSIMGEWVDAIETTVNTNQESAFWLIDYLGSDIGISFIKPFLLECPNREVKQVFAKILEKSISNFFYHGGMTSACSLDRIITHLVDMLDQEVPDNCRNCHQYFWLLNMYIQGGIKACSHLLSKNAFQKFLVFLLGSAAADMEDEESFSRRWSSVQTREFGALHSAMATMVISCDLSPHRTCDPENCSERMSQFSLSSTYLPLTSEVAAALFGPGSVRYIREVVSACREVSGSISVLVDMLVQCSFCNETFSSNVITQIMLQYSSVPSNELKNLSQLLLEILTLEDPLQFTRIEQVIDGYSDQNGAPFEGMLAIIRANQTNDSRRSYQGVKFLVSLAHRCTFAKDYMMQTPTKWQWAVKWLKKMMSEHTFWGPQPNMPLSNEDSNTKTFQRTVSAQDTLAEATALLTELESPENQDAMEFDEEEKNEGLQMKPTPENTDDVDGKLKRVQGMDYLDSIEL